jgi:sporulation protein YlmC with PRC-barrel domain
MLRSLKKIEGYKVSATDGDLGSVVNFLIDDERWTVRYLVVDTGGIFGSRQVLISPISFRDVDHSAERFHVNLTTDKIKNSPSIDLDRPVSRQHERDYYGYYGYPYYWAYGGGLWGMGYYPSAMAVAGYGGAGERPGEPAADVHLRSARELTGYHIEGTDGSIGHVKDFKVDDESWAIRYMVIETSNWWVGKSVLIAPEWTSGISWIDRKVYVAMTRAAIKGSPEWGVDDPVGRAFEEQLYRHYGRMPLRRQSDRRAPEGIAL